jgi:hypothetical protein
MPQKTAFFIVTAVKTSNLTTLTVLNTYIRNLTELIVICICFTSLFPFLYIQKKRTSSSHFSSQQEEGLRHFYKNFLSIYLARKIFSLQFMKQEPTRGSPQGWWQSDEGALCRVVFTRQGRLANECRWNRYHVTNLACTFQKRISVLTVRLHQMRYLALSCWWLHS